MSISYTAIVGNKAKVTNPSIESWYINNNILKDPPKSIMTRRIDKVNQDGSLNEMMYDSGDRFAEGLNVYARGVNPMVSVSYGNSDGTPVKMPYRIIRDGAFRPPILRQEQLLPLSRLPRNTTQAISSKEYQGYYDRVTTPDTKRYFKPEILKGQIAPTKYVNIAMPVKEHFTVNYVNENPLIATALTNAGAKGNTQLDVLTPTRQQNIDPLIATVVSAKQSQKQIDLNTDIQLEKNTPLTFASTGKQSTYYIAIEPDTVVQLDRNLPSYQTSALKTQDVYTKVDAENGFEFQRNLPVYLARTNNFSSDFVAGDNATDYKLAQKTRATTVLLNKYSSNYVAGDNATDYKLAQKLQANSVLTTRTKIDSSQEQNRTHHLPLTIQQGGIEGNKSLPQIERGEMYNPNYTTAKKNLKESMRKYVR